MESTQTYEYPELVEKNRKIVNEKLSLAIREGQNQILGLFFDMLNNSKIRETKDFLHKLQIENAKPSRIKRREFRYKHLNDIQKSILKILKQFFDDNFVDLVSDPNI